MLVLLTYVGSVWCVELKFSSFFENVFRLAAHSNVLRALELFRFPLPYPHSATSSCAFEKTPHSREDAGPSRKHGQRKLGRSHPFSLTTQIHEHHAVKDCQVSIFRRNT